VSTMLITGAAGSIGSSLARQLHDRYAFRLTDVRPPEDTYDCPFVEADIADYEAIRAVCRGVETVIHLAADPSEEATWDSLLPRNVIGTYNVFEAAREAGCRRVIFASSVHAVFAYERGVQVRTTMPVRPQFLYGATKAWGEAVGCNYAEQHGLSVICLRFGWVVAREMLAGAGTSDDLDMAVTYEDLARLVVASIEAPPDFTFGVFHGISDNRWKRFDISDARERLGYAPEDDAFAIAGVFP
jgi:nucleoside-diphosphate-sugar epimerase